MLPTLPRSLLNYQRANLSLEGDCHEVEVTPNSKLSITFGMSLEGVCQEFYTYFHYNLTLNLEVTKNNIKKLHHHKI
jgi:hypothetical protein